MNSAVAVPNRNGPCPCGSGKRAKHCCGAGGVSVVAQRAPAVPDYTGWATLPLEERKTLWQKMLDALTAQRDFRFDIAGSLYEEVLARAPLTFDALHMLGAVRMMEGEYDVAESLLTHARELAPDDEKVRHNLAVLAQRRAEHEGLYSLRNIVATDMLRLFAAKGRFAAGGGSRYFESGGAGAAHTHIVIPAVPTMAGSNHTGATLARRLGARATLWSGPQCDPTLAEFLSARRWESAEAESLRGGRLILFGLNAGVLAWLPAIASAFEAIVIALDAHDPIVCVDLLGRFDRETLRRTHFVARSAAMLEDLGLPGDVDPMTFGEQRRSTRTARAMPERPRIGVFIPALRDHEDAERWRMLEWLREQPLFLRVLYPGRLPSPHRASVDEHLLGLASEWDGWERSLDALFYWGAEGHMRQYDRLVFDAIDAGLAVVADGFGDFGAALSRRNDCTQFFDSNGARAAISALLESWTMAAERVVA